ncbi:MAG: cytochrome c4 [Rudaea sp.]|nr:cytochrome c4 [Rudaea sp.]
MMPNRLPIIIAAFLALAATTAAAQAGFGEHLAACAACHGEHGEGVRGSEYYPHLAGKPAGYLFEQLKGFRDGRRTNTQMTWLVQFADDRFLHEIADHYAALAPRTRAADTGAAALTSARRKVAETLVEHGDPGRGVPACSECHGTNLAGLEPGVPALVGLPADYVIAQFGSWREGIRHGAPPDCMHDVAERIAPEDIRAIATWLSQQSNPDGARPAPAGSFVPPKACGSLPHAENAP